ncbi:hypothetical protein E4U55_007832, partial [Claviceps digitariae]
YEESFPLPGKTLKLFGPQYSSIPRSVQIPAQKNVRFSTYCPYCQTSTSLTPLLLPPRLRDPPSYTPTPTPAPAPTTNTAPPPYTPCETGPRNPEKKQHHHDDNAPAEDVLHFLNHDLDSITSLSLRYNVPAGALRRANRLTSDHLLWGRRTVCIPGGYYTGGVSLSPRPVHGEEEERRKSRIRRFMTSCKVFDYDVAVLYLEQWDYDVGLSVEAYLGDEAWEREHPRQGSSRGGLWSRRGR